MVGMGAYYAGRLSDRFRRPRNRPCRRVWQPSSQLGFFDAQLTQLAAHYRHRRFTGRNSGLFSEPKSVQWLWPGPNEE